MCKYIPVAPLLLLLKNHLTPTQQQLVRGGGGTVFRVYLPACVTTTLLRPLLTIDRELLSDYCKAAGAVRRVGIQERVKRSGLGLLET